jgi:hypothetical protein
VSESLSWADVGARRLERNHLGAPSADASAADVAAAMCGTHAQVMAAAELSIAIRTAGGTRSDVQTALWSEHSLIKTYGLRGTVHLFPARDLGMWTGALAAMPSRTAAFPEGVRLSASESERIVEAIAAALEDAALTADELEAEIVARVGSWAGERSMDAFQAKWPRWRMALYDAVTAGAICFGPNRGPKVTWTGVRRLIPGFAPMDGDEAVRALLRAYLWTYGPSTPEWFARWVAAPKPWASKAFASLGEEIAEIEVEGTRTWLLADDQEFSGATWSASASASSSSPASSCASASSSGVRLLPYFDAYTIAWQPRPVMFPGRASQRALAGGQAGPVPVLLVDGVVAGVWQQRKATKRLAITVEPFVDLRPSQRDELDAQVARLGEISGQPAELTIGEVTIGAHA